MGERIKTGIIGFGLSGRVFHAPFIHTHPGFQLSHIVERHHHRSKDIYPTVHVVKDYHELLNKHELELIVITTPNTLHFPMAAACLKAGKHVVIEKPFTPTSQEADKLISLSEETGKQIFVYQNRRWDGDFLTIRKLIDKKVLGEILEYEAHFDRFRPEINTDAWREQKIPGAGVLYDLGSHLIDQALVLFGKPDAIRAHINKEREGSMVDDSFWVDLHYPGIKATLRAGMMVKNIKPRYVIRGRDGQFTKQGIDPQESRLKAGEMPVESNFGKEDPEYWGILKKSGEPAKVSVSIPTENGNYMAFYKNVYDSIRQNKPFPVRPDQARDVIFIIEKAFESSKKNQLIKFNN
jgi:predicted dehydrogenase